MCERETRPRRLDRPRVAAHLQNGLGGMHQAGAEERILRKRAARRRGRRTGEALESARVGRRVKARLSVKLDHVDLFESRVRLRKRRFD